MAAIHNKNQSVCEMVNKGATMLALLSVTHQTATVTVPVLDGARIRWKGH